MSTPSQERAGLWVRLLAFAWDYLIILAYLVSLVAAGALTNRFASALTDALFSGPVRAQAIGFMLSTLPVALYFALLEASPRQATWGKRRVGLFVVNASGLRLSLARSFVRTAVKFVPWELAHLCIWQIAFATDPTSPVYTAGFIAVWVLVGTDLTAMFIGQRRQALHDRVAGAFVVRRPSVT